MFIIVSIPKSTCWVRWMYPTAASQVRTDVTRVQNPTVNRSITTKVSPWTKAISVGSVTWNQTETVACPWR